MIQKANGRLKTLWLGRAEQIEKRNLVAKRLIELRKSKKLSQRGLAKELLLMGIDMDKNVITRIETDIELQAITRVFNVFYDYPIEGINKKNIDKK